MLREITDEVKSSYLSYAMSVIIGRAIPDARDGLKPVQRRILYAMYDMSLFHNKAHKKSARVVGETLGKYHPHGDSAVYDALVRMAQDFSLRYPLVDGQGNFGSIDGDNAAAMRYTEVRLSKIAEEMLVDIDKDTVDFTANFDNSLKEPVVLPAKIPNLLINGSSGIAVGLATNIPTHNLGEVCDALILLLDNPDASLIEIMQYIKGPDFPTYATIINKSDLASIYASGKGVVYLRANYKIEDSSKKRRIVFYDLPYKVNKASLLEKIAKLVNEKKIKGISDLRDESNREGIRIVVELQRDVEPEIVVKNLYKHSDLETGFAVNMVALDGKKPKLMSLKELLQVYIRHRIEVTKRWLNYEIKRLLKKLHILEGLLIALANIDEVISIIKKSKDPKEAKVSLMNRFSLSEDQSQAILDMKLQKLTGLEREKLLDEHKSTKELYEKYKAILENRDLLIEHLKNEILEIKKKYADERRTSLEDSKISKDFDFRSFVANKKQLIVLTESGYIKRMDLEQYRQQHRGGVGVKASSDKVLDALVADLHDRLLLFTNTGRVFYMDCFYVPELSRNAKGRYLANYLKLKEGESIVSFIAVSDKEDYKGSIVFVTKKAKIKKMPFSYLSKIRSNGLIVMKLNPDDRLSAVKIVKDKSKLMIVSKKRASLFEISELRDMGRNAMGVKAMSLDENDSVVSVCIVDPDSKVLFVSEKGYAKLSKASDFRETRRGAKGVKAMNTDKAGYIVKARRIDNEKELLLLTKKGLAIRIDLDSIPLLSRNTKGVKVLRLKEDDLLYDFEVW